MKRRVAVIYGCKSRVVAKDPCDNVCLPKSMRCRQDGGAWGHWSLWIRRFSVGRIESKKYKHMNKRELLPAQGRKMHEAAGFFFVGVIGQVRRLELGSNKWARVGFWIGPTTHPEAPKWTAQPLEFFHVGSYAVVLHKTPKCVTRAGILRKRGRLPSPSQSCD